MNSVHDQDQIRGWCLILLDVFHDMQAATLQLRTLQPPNIVFSDKLSRTLGQWNEDRRQITLSQRLVADGAFSLLVDVFKHEVAHQVVSELFGIRNAVHHGEAFRRACKLLAIPHRADEEYRIAPADDAHKLLRRVHKLTAMATSSNVHEAELALKKARELTLKYNLKSLQHQTADFGLRPVGPQYKRVPSYIWSICGIVSDFYYCLYICRPVHHDGNVERVIELYGDRQNLDIAEYVFHFLMDQGEREWQRYRRENRIRGRRLRQSFLKGVYAGFRQSLDRQTVELAQNKALVWSGDPRLEEFFQQRNPRVHTRKIQSRVNSDTHAAGKEIGQNLSIRPPIRPDSSSTGKPALLQ